MSDVDPLRVLPICAFQESEVLKRRLDAATSAMNDALETMGTKDGMMRWLDMGTKHLGLLVGLGESAAEVH